MKIQKHDNAVPDKRKQMQDVEQSFENMVNTEQGKTEVKVEKNIEVNAEYIRAEEQTTIEGIENLNIDPALKANLKRLEPYLKKASKMYKVENLEGIGFGEEVSSGDSWHYVDQLPSRMIGYPAGIVILQRPYTYEELDTINDGQLNDSELLQFMCKGILVKGMPKEQLYMDDILYICLLRKISSLGTETFNVQYEHIDLDGEKTKYTQVFHLNQLNFNELSAPELPVVTTIGGVECHFRPLNLETYTRNVALGHAEDKYYVMASLISNLPIDKAHKLVTNAMGIDIMRLNLVDKLLSMSVEPINFTYRHKGEVYNKRIDVTNVDSLVTPFCILSELEGHTVRFGLHEGS